MDKFVSNMKKKPDSESLFYFLPPYGDVRVGIASNRQQPMLDTLFGRKTRRLEGRRSGERTDKRKRKIMSPPSTPMAAATTAPFLGRLAKQFQSNLQPCTCKQARIFSAALFFFYKIRLLRSLHLLIVLLMLGFVSPLDALG